MQDELKENHGTCYDFAGNDLEYRLMETTGTDLIVVGILAIELPESSGTYYYYCTDAVCGGAGDDLNYFRVKIVYTTP